MNLDVLLNSDLPIAPHAIAAIAAIGLGGVQLMMKKGTTQHKVIGYAWVLLMLFVSISSFFIHTIDVFYGFSPIHLLSLFTIGSVCFAVLSVRAGNIEEHAKAMKRLYLLALLVTGAFTFIPGRIMHQTLFGG